MRKRATPQEARDRNKSALTHAVTAAAVHYLDERGYKPIETEVPVTHGGQQTRGWVADIAAFCYPTPSEAIKLKILRRRPQISYASPEMEVWRAEYEHLPAHICYLAIPQGLLSPKNFPPGWTVLEFRNDHVRPATTVTRHQLDSDQVVKIVAEIAIRRDHFTRFARLRAAQKEDRARRAEERPFALLSQALSLLLQVRQGGLDESDTLERVLRCYRIKKLPAQTRQRLEEIWGSDRSRIGDPATSSSSPVIDQQVW